ncbi:MAG: hypothetical protein WEE64_10965 [Dehalococcoidia bacterium]
MTSIVVMTTIVVGLLLLWLIVGERTMADVLTKVLPGPDINDVLDYLETGATPTATPTPTP